MFDNFKEFRHRLIPDETIYIEPDNTKEGEFLPKFPIKYRNDFYYFYEISYYDDALKRTFKQSYFYHYHKVRNIGDFYFCKDDEKALLIKNINNELKKINEPIISDE